MYAECLSCLVDYPDHYSVMHPRGVRLRGRPGDPYGVCSDCDSLACRYHGVRRTTGGFICIQCDPAATLSSGAVRSTVDNTVRDHLLVESGRGRPVLEWAQPNVQEWSLSFADR